MCEQLNCKYKPKQKWCGYHDPERYHKNGKLHKQRLEEHRSIINEIKQYIDIKIKEMIRSIDLRLIDLIQSNNEKILQGVNNLLIKEHSPRNSFNMFKLGID